MNEQLKDPVALPLWRGDPMRIEYEVVALDKRRIACCCRESSQDCWSVHPVARTDWVFHIPISFAIPHLKEHKTFECKERKKKQN